MNPEREQQEQPPALPGVGPPALPGDAQPWHRRSLVIVLGLLSVGPLALPLVWLHPRLSGWWKLCITIAVIALTWGCIVLTRIMIDHLKEQLNLILELSE